MPSSSTKSTRLPPSDHFCHSVMLPFGSREMTSRTEPSPPYVISVFGGHARPGEREMLEGLDAAAARRDSSGVPMCGDRVPDESPGATGPTRGVEESSLRGPKIRTNNYARRVRREDDRDAAGDEGACSRDWPQTSPPSPLSVEVGRRRVQRLRREGGGGREERLFSPGARGRCRKRRSRGEGGRWDGALRWFERHAARAW